ncbi:GNAT family N-acetyltransferase [Sphingomonas sp.]|uniref:GNAT family N-acetyltransferase n=1 Tax=Sphingomonas sp. TaxID=28214 RepID=UPI0031DA3BF2
MAVMLDNRLTLRRMTPDDVAAVHRLSKAEQWPHREEDLADMLAVGQGIVMEMSGEIVGSTMWWKAGETVTTLGMVIVSRQHRGGGFGRIVMEAALDAIGDGTIMLNATEDGLPLYRRLGFNGIAEILQHQGTAFHAPLVPLNRDERIRPLGGADPAIVEGMVEAATGLTRPAIMTLLLDKAHGIVLDRGGTVTGCALFRRFGRGYVVGPVVAPDVLRAKALIAQWLGSRSGEFIRLDIPGECHLSGWLEELGLVQVGRVVTMVRGPVPPVAAPGQSFAIISQALC